MKCFLTVSTLVLLFADASSAFFPYQGPNPLFVFIETDPWANVPRTPHVVIYENGEILIAKHLSGDDAFKPELRSQSINNVVYYRVALPPEKLEELSDHWNPLNMPDLKERYSISHVSDQPSSIFLWQNQGVKKLLEVYGLAEWQAGHLKTAQLRREDPSLDVPPQEVFAIHNWLCRLDFDEKTVWIPEYLEIELTDFSNARAPSIEWPEGWPTISSERAQKTHNGGYRLFLDGAKLQELKDLLAKRNSYSAVLVNGRKWSISFIPVFPGAPSWRPFELKTPLIPD